MSSYRQDRRTPADNDWGKPQVNYPTGRPEFPQIIETGTHRQSEQLPAALSPHPDFPNALLIAYKTEPGGNRDANWWLTYDTLPGPIITGSQIDNTTGIVINYSKQRVASGTVSGGIIGAAVLSLHIIDGGSGFTGNGTLVISGGGGSGATGTFTATVPSPAGQLDTATLVSGGAGFTAIPGYTIGGGGSGGTVTIKLVGKPIASLTKVSSDNTFDDAPTLTISDSTGNGSGATGTATLTPTTIASIPVDAGGGGYSSATVTFLGGGGSGAAGTVNLTGDVVTSITVDNPGSGYTSRPTAVITGDGNGAAAHTVLTGTTVASGLLTSSGNNYESPSVTCTDGNGHFATFDATIQPTSVKSVTVDSSGSGYTAPTITISGGGGSGATATLTIKTGTITSVLLTANGANYTSSPSVTTSGGGGTGAIIKAVISGITYVSIQPESSVVDWVMKSSVDLSTLPPAKSYPISYRVERGDTQTVNFDYVYAGDLVDVGIVESAKRGGTGPAPATLTIQYMTESQYQAYFPGTYSVTGQSETNTIAYGWVDARGPHVLNARITPIGSGTTAGVVDVTAEQHQFGIWKVHTVSVDSTG